MRLALPLAAAGGLLGSAAAALCAAPSWARTSSVITLVAVAAIYSMAALLGRGDHLSSIGDERAGGSPLVNAPYSDRAE